MTSANKIDVCLFTDKTRFLRLKTLRLRAVYVTIDAEIVVRYEGCFRKVYQLPDGILACFLSDAAFRENVCHRVTISEIEDGVVDVSAQSAQLLSLHNKGGMHKAWVAQSGLGTYLYFNGSEHQFTELLVDLHEAKIPRIISWEDGYFDGLLNDTTFNWRAKFASSVNMYGLFKKISDILNYLPDDPSHTEQKILVGNNTAPSKTVESNPKPEGLHLEKDVASDIAQERVGKTEKLMREAMFHLLPNLAIHPDVGRLLSKNIDSVGPLLSVLQRMDIGERIPFKKIQASAGSSGWREVNDHISTGRSKSLRVYYRKNSCLHHRLDVFVENKINKNAQNKTFDRLAKMNLFDSREVIFQ